MTDTEERVRRYADNAVLMLLSRWSMVLVLPFCGAFLTLGGMYLNARFADQADAIQAIDNRVRNVESAQGTGQAAVSTLQNQLGLTQQSVQSTTNLTATFETSTSQRLDKMNDILTGLSNQVAALNATVTLMEQK